MTMGFVIFILIVVTIIMLVIFGLAKFFMWLAKPVKFRNKKEKEQYERALHSYNGIL